MSDLILRLEKRLADMDPHHPNSGVLYQTEEELHQLADRMAKADPAFTKMLRSELLWSDLTGWQVPRMWHILKKVKEYSPLAA